MNTSKFSKAIKDVDREEAERWLQTVMPLYEQAATLTHKIAKVDNDGLPADLTTLIEVSTKLTPILKSVKEIPKPREKELRKLQKDFKQALDACISASKWGVKLSQKPNRVRFSVTVFWTSLANSFMESLSKKLALLSEYLNSGR